MITQFGSASKAKANELFRLLSAASYAALMFATCAIVCAADSNKACGLLTQKELAAVLGPTNWNTGGTAMATARGGAQNGSEMCSATTSAANILLRLAKKTGREAQGLDNVKKMGAQVEVKTLGPMTCSSLIPPKGLEQIGFNTTCSIQKGDQVAAIEVTTKSAKDMVPIETLRTLAEKMTPRF